MLSHWWGPPTSIVDHRVADLVAVKGTPVVSYFRSGRSGLALGVFILPPISSFLRSSYLLDSSVKYIYMPLYPHVLVYQD